MSSGVLREMNRKRIALLLVSFRSLIFSVTNSLKRSWSDVDKSWSILPFSSSPLLYSMLSSQVGLCLVTFVNIGPRACVPCRSWENPFRVSFQLLSDLVFQRSSLRVFNPGKMRRLLMRAHWTEVHRPEKRSI